MAIIAPTLPVIGDPNSTADSNTLGALTALENAINGQLDVVNLSAAARNALMPWTIHINPVLQTVANTNWYTVAIRNAAPGNAVKISTGQVNNSISWDVTLAQGTWDVYANHEKNSDNGIMTVALDGVSVGTIDCYAAAFNANAQTAIASVAVGTTGKKRLTFTMASKNASSTSYFGSLSGLGLVRTA